MTDHEKRIREALEAGPTEGEWRDCGGYTPEFGALYSDAGYIVYRYADATVDTEHGKPIKAPSNEQQFANRKFIAACNPAAIRALLADLDAVRADAQRYRYLRDVAWGDGSLVFFDHRYDKDEWDAKIDAALKGASHE